MSISRDQVQHLAELAHIDLDEDKVDKYRDELTQILDYVEKLDELDLSDVEPTTHAVPMQLRLRDDEVESSLSEKDAMRNAPNKRDGQFQVPRVVED